MDFNRECFTFHAGWYNAVATLDNNVRLEVYDAIMRKALFNEPPSLSVAGRVAMAFIEPQLEQDTDKWLMVREKRKESGKKGGLAKASKCYQMLPNASTCQNALAQESVDTIMSSPINNNYNIIHEDKDKDVLIEKEKETHKEQEKAALEEKKEKDNLFEKCWVAYNRKGSKKKARAQWDKLSQKDREKVMPHITAYVGSRERQFQRDFERYLRDKTFLDVIIKGNNVVYDPTKLGKGESASNVYMPSGNFSIMWDDQLKAYIYIGYYNTGMNIPDGYTDDNRPDGARIVLNNGRGELVWAAITKTWIKQ